MLALLTQNAGGKVPIRLETALGVGITGVAAGSVTAKLSKNLTAYSSFPLAGSNWTEIGDGMYAVTLATGDTDTLGGGLVQVTHLGVQFVAPFQVRATDEATLAAAIAAVQTTVNTINSVKSSQASVNTLTTNLASLANTVNGMLTLDDNALSRMTVLTRATGPDGPVGAPLTARVYVWDSQINYNAATATGRVEYLVTCTYDVPSGRVATFSKARV